MLQKSDSKKFIRKKNRSIFLPLALLFLLIFLWSSDGFFYQSSFGRIGGSFSGLMVNLKNKVWLSYRSDSERRLEEQNGKLMEENALLKEKIFEAGIQIADDFTKRFKTEEIIVTGKESFSNQPLLFALKKPEAIIGSGMAVVDKNGFLVGVTDKTENRTLQILLAQNHRFRVGAKIAGTEWSGVISGSHDLRAVLEMLPLETAPEPKAPVITDNSNPYIPAGISIGTLTQVSESDDHLFKEALIDLPWKSESFSKLWVITGANY